MGLAQLTLDGSDLVMLVLTTIIALVGFLLSYQLKQRDAMNQRQDRDIQELQTKMTQVRQAMGFTDRPSDWKVKKPPSGGSSA